MGILGGSCHHCGAFSLAAALLRWASLVEAATTAVRSLIQRPRIREDEEGGEEAVPVTEFDKLGFAVKMKRGEKRPSQSQSSTSWGSP
jgi:hypothetical protein